MVQLSAFDVLKTFLHDWYAVILSTIVFGWQFYQWRTDRKGKIKLRASIGTQAITSGRTVGEFKKTLFVTITNHGKNTRTIDQCNITTNTSKRNQSYSVIDFMSKNDLPKSLSFGEIMRKTYDLSILDEIYQKKRFSKIRFVATDTLGKQYFSNYLEYQFQGAGGIST